MSPEVVIEGIFTNDHWLDNQPLHGDYVLLAFVFVLA